MSVELNINTEIVEINEVSEVVTINDVNEIVEINFTGGIGPAGAGFPSGGTTNQVLAKNSNIDYDTEWVDAGAGTVTSVAALTIGITGTDLSSTVANSTTTPVITLNVPTASATNRGVLSSDDWTIFNNKTSVNLYTGDGTLTGNRLVTMGSYTLSFEKDLLVNGLTIGKGKGNISNNTSIGVTTLLNNTTGYANTAIGKSAIYSNTSGSGNTAIGNQSLTFNTIGYSNSAIGSESLRSNTTGFRNSALGDSSLYHNTTGYYNTALGYRAGVGNATTQNTTGNNNIFIGYFSVGVSSTESNRTWIGNDSTLSTWLGGNLLLGTTTNAGYKLDVVGSARISSTTTLSSLAGIGNRMVIADATGILSTQAITIGTVTFVDMSVPLGFTISGNPIINSGTLALSMASGYSIPTDANQSTWTTAYNNSIVSAAVSGTTTKTLTLNQQDGGTITATWSDIDTGLTSVGLSMPVAFSVANTPLTSNGTLAVTAIGTAAQYIRGDGQLATLPSGASGGSSVNYYLNGSINQGTIGGSVYYEMNRNAVIGTGTDFTRTNAAGDGLIAQFITDANDPNRLEIPSGAWNFEMYFSSSSAGGTPAFYVELLKYDGTTFTSIANGSTNPEGITGGTSTDLYLTSLAVPQTTLLATDRLAIRVYVITSGKDITLHTEDNNLCEIITTFAGGIAALNGLTANTQYFAVGTSGTDFAISSLSDTHTFNIPDASITARGLVTTGLQTFGGNKTFDGSLTLNNQFKLSIFGATFQNVVSISTPPVSSGYLYAKTDKKIYYKNSDGTDYDLTNAGSVTSISLATGTSGTDINVSGSPITSSGTITLNIPDASATARGVVTTGSQTFAGAKTFNNEVTVNGTTIFNAQVRIDNSSIVIKETGGISIPSANFGFLYAKTDKKIWYKNSDGTDYDLTANSGGTVTSVGLSSATSGVTIGSTPVTTSGTITLAIATASGSQQGLLSSTDWTTFNNKQNALTNPVTGTGTSGQVAYFNGTSSITSESALYWDAANDRLGLGTSSPGYDIQVKKSDATLAVSSSDGTSELRMNAQSGLAIFETITNTDLRIRTNSTERMRLTSGGNLLVGTTTDSGEKLVVSGTAKFLGGDVTHEATTSNANLILKGSATNDSSLYFLTGSTFKWNINTASNDLIFFKFQGGVGEAMRITSSGRLGIGTTSPWQNLHVIGTAAIGSAKTSGTGSATISLIGGVSDTRDIGYVFSGAANREVGAKISFVGSGNLSSYQGGYITFSTSEAGGTTFPEVMRITTSGNLGLGVTPSAWGFSGNIEFSDGRVLMSSGQYLHITQNAFNNGTNWIYKTTNATARYSQEIGKHIWYNAASGTAGTTITFTQAMTLTSAGRLLLGTATESTYLLDVNGSGRFTGALTINSENSNAYSLNVLGRSADNASTINFFNNAGSTRYGFIYNDATGMYFGVNGSTRLTIGTSGAATFSAQGVAGYGTINLESDDPFVRFFDNGSGSTTDKKKWDIRAVAAAGVEALDFRTINDANTVFSTKLSIAHSGAATFSSSVTATQYRLSALNTAPASASDTGTLGEIRVDANYIYVCTATNTWKRSAITTW